MTIDNETNTQEITDEENIFNKWLQLEESDETNEVKNTKISEYLRSALKETSTDENSVYENVHKLGGKKCCRLSFLPFGLGAIGGKGHFELTTDVFNNHLNTKLSPIAINNFALASRYPDLYYPEQLHYHAMSAVDNNYVLLDKTGQQDIKKLIDLLKSHLNHLDLAISTDDINSIFFYVGMLFHSIQDLVVHKGMTSPQHAHLNKEGKSPDDDYDALKLGEMISNSFMKNFIYERLTTKTDLLEKCNQVGELDSLSYRQIKERKQEIINNNTPGKWLSAIPFKGDTVSHVPFLLAEIRAFSNSAEHYDINKNAITWGFISFVEDWNLIDSVEKTIFSELPKKAI